LPVVADATADLLEIGSLHGPRTHSNPRLLRQPGVVFSLLIFRDPGEAWFDGGSRDLWNLEPPAHGRAATTVTKKDAPRHEGRGEGRLR
jgi:hypothetical protein